MQEIDHTDIPLGQRDPTATVGDEREDHPVLSNLILDEHLQPLNTDILIVDNTRQPNARPQACATPENPRAGTTMVDDPAHPVDNDSGARQKITYTTPVSEVVS